MIKIYKHIILLSLFSLVIAKSMAQADDLPNPPAHLETIPIGSLVIPMDNTHQNLTAPFNLKAYGLVNALLQNDIPVKWVIKSGKLKDGIDFSATVQRVYPTALAASLEDFRASAFIIDSTWVNKTPYSNWGQTASQIIAAFGGNVAVYKLTQNVTVDVRYNMKQRPKIAVFSNGGNQNIHTIILNNAGISNYTVISAGVFSGLAECYTFCSEAHWASEITDTAIMRKPVDFVYSGGNFFAQCHAVQTGTTDGYETHMKIQSTNAFSEIGINTTANTYYNPDLAIMQFHGLMRANQGGSGKNWRLAPGSSWRNGHYYAVSTLNSHDTVVVSCSKLTTDPVGGNVFYMGGHQYLGSFTDIELVNAGRIYLNAALIPAKRPSAFAIVTGPSSTICKGQQVQLSATGPVGATYQWTPTTGLNNPTSATPIATPTVTTTYGVTAMDGSCPGGPAFTTVTVNPIPVAPIAGSSSPACVGSTLTLSANTISGATYSWTGPNGFSSTLQNPIIASVTAASAGIYSVTATVGGCPGPAGTTTVIINPTPASISSQINVSCYGGSNGSASVNATGGTPAYTYLWNNGQTTQSATGLTVGSYTATVTDSKVCTTSTTVSISQPAAPLTSSSSQTNVSCFGGSNGSASVVATGGTPPYTYLWSNGQTNTNATGLIAGTYTVTTTDSKSCTSLMSVTITEPAILSANVSQTNVSCYGGNNGSALISTPSGGTSPYTYLWSNGQISSSITELAIGTYSLTVTDAKGCTITASATITQPIAPLSFITSQTNVSCFGGNNGSASAIAAGGTPAYSYLWMPGNQTTSSISNLTIGTYTITVNDTKGCNTTGFITITQPAVLAVNFINQTNVSCFAGNNGSVTASASGGIQNYTYLWMPGSVTTSAISNIPIGTYTVTVTDNQSCQLQNNVTITQPVAALSVSVSSTPTSCYGGTDGAVASVVTGGTSPYTYNWLPGNNTTQNVSSLSAGNYTVTVTDSKLCTISNSVTVNQPLQITLVSGTINSTCSLANGSAYVSVAGGVGSYTHQWSPVGGNSDTARNLFSGTYTVLVTDGNSCSTSQSLNVNDNNSPTVSIISKTDVTCNGGSTGTAGAGISGGTGPFTYSWAPYGGSTPNATGLSAGTYTLTVTDVNGCQSLATTSPAITEPVALVLTVTTTDVSCFSGSNGSAAVSASGGTPGYSYTWLPSGITGTSINNLSAGTYTVQVTDINSCVLTKTFTINQPNQLSVFISNSSNVSCKGGNDGTATASVSGGTPFYNYNWLPMGGNGPTGTGLSVGTYTVNVTDNNSCTSSITILITEPSQVLTSATSQNNVSCFGGNSGAATVTASGGTLSYTYLWNNGQTSSTIGVLTAGNYAVTTTDAKGCITTTSLSITQPAMALAYTTTQNNVSCYGGTNGSSSVIATGGTPPYIYLWSNGQTTSSVSGLITGNYTVTVTDFKGCTTTASISISQPTAPLTSSTLQTNVSCFGESNGSASVIPTGGTSPYTYLWNNGQTTVTATGLIAGNYSVTTTDSKSCTTVISITITEPALLSSNVSQTNVSCYGGNNGSALVSTPSGGTSPYTYLWSNGQISSSITELIVGTYSLTVTDAKGCTITASATITQPIAPLSFTTSQTNVSCFGGNNGSANVVAADGTPAYSYLWVPGNQTTSSISNLTIGTYTITVTDAKGCNAIGFITITQPAVLSVNFINQTNVSCFAGNNGSVTASASGGIQNYTYLWMPGSVTASAISNIPIGTYTVTVTDNQSCQVQNNVTITQPIAALSVSVSSTPTSCYGGTDGSVASVASGGTSPYTYNWLPGNHTTQNVSNLSAGNYTVTVTDSKLCTISNSVIVNQPAQIVLVPGTVNSTCTLPNGSAFVSVSGGAGSYAYQWSPSGGNNDTATGLFSAAYTVLVTDGNGCSTSQSLNVNDNNSPTVTIISKTDVTCNGGSTGTAGAGISGGTGPFTYSWAPYGGNTPNATGLTAGTYTLTVTDANGCQSLATTSPAITEPVALMLTVTTTDVSCFSGSNGTASVSASGGTPGYSYTWLPSGSTGTSINNLSAGTYTVQVTDINSCVLTKNFTINQPNQLSIFISTSSNVSCKGGNDGTATANVSGGTPFFNYNWLPMGGNAPTGTGLSAGTYTVSVTDNNSCTSSITILITEPSQALTSITSQNNVSCFGGNNGTATVTASGGTLSYTYLWNNGQTVSSIGVLIAGNYAVTTTDAKGCITTTSISITQPAMALASTTTQSNISCFGGSNGSASVIATGGTPPFTYLWNNGQTTSSATGLITGNYSVTVTDFKGCTTTASISISQPIAPLASTTSQNNVSCFGESSGSASVIPTGGTSPYAYLWNNGQTATTATGLIAGNYTVTTTDINGCVISSNLSITEPAILSSTAVQTNICSGASNGWSTVSVSGGTLPYSYLWNDGQTTSPVTGLSVGNYSVISTDAKGCTTTATVAITLFPAIFSTISHTDVSCNGGNNGSVSVIPSGGTTPFAYQWNNGFIAPSITGLIAGNYTVTITDANGCTITQSASVAQPAAALSAVASQTNVSCFGGNNGSASVTALGGTPSYTYQWNTGQTQYQISNLISQTYTVIVTDTNGCMATTSVSITEPPTPLSSVTSQSTLSCFGDNNGSASVVASGGISPYTYLWSNGQTNSSIIGLTAGSYSVTTTDLNGCIVVDVISITEPSVLSSTSVQTNICTGATNGLATVSISGGTIPYSYLWSNGQTNSSATGLSAGNYSVTTADANGCTATSIGTITQFPAISSTTLQTNVSCNGGNNGSASIIPSGGTPPFTYQWNNGLTTSSITALIVGNYSGTVTDVNGCAATASALVTEPSLLIVSIGSIVNTTCYNGSNGSASSTATGGVSPYLYNWSTVPNQTNSGAMNLSAGTYTASVTDSNGCISTSNVTIAQPSQIITIAGANDSICLGQSGVITAIASGGGGGYSYTWLPSNTTNSGALTITPSSSVTYTVTAQDQYGCVGVSDSVSGIIYQLNPANIQVIGNSPICPGQSSVISVQTSGVTGTLTYLWNNNLGTGTGPYTVTPSQPTTYLVTVTNQCGNSVTEGIQILFNPPPTVNLTSDTNQNCAPALIQFYDNSVTGNNTDPITTWYWDFGDGTSSLLQNPIHNYTQLGTYSVVLTVTTSGGCTNNNGSSPLIITVHVTPTAAFSVNSINLDLPHDVLNCTNQSVGANIYNWSFGDGNTSNLVHPQNTYTTVGVFQIQLIAMSQYGCRDTAYSEVTTNVDVVFPNVFTPNTDGSIDGNYEMNNMDNDIFFPYTSGVIEFKLEIFNRWGEQIFESLDVKKGWNGYYKGALCQQDVYVWKAYVKLNNGKVFHKSGDVTLLR